MPASSSLRAILTFRSSTPRPMRCWKPLASAAEGTRMTDWLAPVTSAFIAAAAVILTTLVNNRSAEKQRRELRLERARDRDHELHRWQTERESERQKWLLDRRRDAYIVVLEYAFESYNDDEAAAVHRAQMAELQVTAFGSQRVVDAFRAWNQCTPIPGVEMRDHPAWLHLTKYMREDLGTGQDLPTDDAKADSPTG
jgi:hypothetical protein